MKRTAQLSIVSMFAVVLAVAGCGTDEKANVSKVPVKAPDAPASIVDTSTPAVDVAVTPAPAIEATYENSEAAFLDGRYEEAFDLFARYTGQRESNPWGHYMLGMSAWKTGRLEAAEVAFKRAIELDSTLVKAHLNLGRVLIEASRPTEALATIDRAIVVEGETSVAYRLKGNAYHTLGQSEDALAAYRRAIQVDPQDAWSMNNLAFILIEEGRYDEALPALARATELRKDVPVFFNNLGMALEQAGQFRAAESAYTYAASLGGVSGKAVANRDRVIGIIEQPGLEPVDLAVLARTFEVSVKDDTALAITSDLESLDTSRATTDSDSTISAQTPR